MLDISIKHLTKEIKSNKTAFDFCQQQINVVEKFDGTKLTLIRNDKPFDPSDYTKNWIVSYKENILFPSEFSGLANRDKEISSKSVGVSQYKFVLDHIKENHLRTESIPNDYEFFIEFIQRKPTITRDYERLGGLYLVGFGPATYSVQGGRVTSLAEFVSDPEKYNEYCELLNINSFPLIFEGSLSSIENIESGIKNDIIQSLFNERKRQISNAIQSNTWLSVIELMSQIFSLFTSSLGGDSEGAVITTASGVIYKTVKSDQYDKDLRLSKKVAMGQSSDKEAESSYFAKIAEFIKEKIDENDLDDESIESSLNYLSNLVYSMSREEYADVGIDNQQKQLLVIQDDAMSIARLLIRKRTAVGMKKGIKIISIGVIPMAVKPIHDGHWQMIQEAAAENDKVFLIVSVKGRSSDGVEIRGQDMLRIWKEFLSAILPANVEISYSKSPIVDAMGVVKFYEDTPGITFTMYSGEKDAGRFSDEVFKAKFPRRWGAGEISKKIIPLFTAQDGSELSGTRMRSLIQSGDQNTFVDMLPTELSDESKKRIWNILYKEKSSMLSESILRALIRANL